MKITKKTSATVMNLANCVRYANTHKEDFEKNYNLDESILKDFKSLGVTSKLVFELSSLFQRDSFRVDYIVNGKLEQEVKKLYLNGIPEKIKQVKALKEFVLAMDKYFGDRFWLKNKW